MIECTLEVPNKDEHSTVSKECQKCTYRNCRSLSKSECNAHQFWTCCQILLGNTKTFSKITKFGIVNIKIYSNILQSLKTVHQVLQKLFSTDISECITGTSNVHKNGIWSLNEKAPDVGIMKIFYNVTKITAVSSTRAWHCNHISKICKGCKQPISCDLFTEYFC